MKINKLIRALILISIILTVLSGCVTGKGPGPIAATVYTNGIIYTVDGDDWDLNPQESIAICADGKILFVGTNEGTDKLTDSNTQIIDLKGNVVFPGFLDTHIHPPGKYLTQMFSIYIPALGTKQEAQNIIREFIEANPNDDSYWGSGFSMSLGGDEAAGKGPKKEWLDEICMDKPITLKSGDGHNLWLNSKALELNGITNDSEHATGTIHKDENGNLWGTLSSTYDILVFEQEFTLDQKRVALTAFQDYINSFGYTGGQFILMSLEEAGRPNNEYFDLIWEMEQAGTWNTRAGMMMRFQPETDFDEDLALLIEKRDEIADSGKLKLTTAKFFVDGVVEGGTAYLSEPYSNNTEMGLPPGNNGVLLWDKDMLRYYFSTLMSRGVQMHVHSIGDLATTETLDALEHAQSNNPGLNTRNTLTHLQLVKDSDKIRMAELDIIASMQVFWHPKEPGFFYEVEVPFLGYERAFYSYPVRSLIDNGVLVTFSSDHPVTPDPCPFWGIQAGVTRNIQSGEFYGVDELTSIDDSLWLRNAAERISIKEAVEAFTINGAYQMFMEDSIGSLSTGKWADMVIIDQDIFNIDIIDIHSTNILSVIFAGQVINQGIAP